MVFVGAGGEGSKNFRVDLRLLRSETGRVAQLHEGLIGVVTDKDSYVLHESQRRIQLFQKRESELTQVTLLGLAELFQTALALVTRILAMD